MKTIIISNFNHQIIIMRLKRSINTRHECIFIDPDVVTKLSRLHENFVIVPTDKAANKYTFAYKKYYVDILIEELGFHYSWEGAAVAE